MILSIDLRYAHEHGFQFRSNFDNLVNTSSNNPEGLSNEFCNDSDNLPAETAFHSRLKRHRNTCTLLVALVIAAAFLVYFSLRFGLNSPPSATGDEPSYDAIGWQLAMGNGFREDFSAPEFRRPYDKAAGSQPELMTLGESQPGTVTYRPPLFPFMIAATDLLFGRQFAAIRVLNVLAFAVSGALVARYLLMNVTPAVAVIGIGLFFVIDVRTRLYSRAILTESLAVLLTTMMTLALMKVTRSRRCRDAALLGMIGGLSILNRTAFVLWLPILAIGLLWLTRRPAVGTVAPTPTVTAQDASAAQGTLQHRLTLVAVMLLATVAVYAPWAIRNVMVLGKFMPTGTQGLMELPTAFSDRAYEHRGVWVSNPDDFFSEVDRPGQSRLQQEVVRAEYSRRVAAEWIASHPVRAAVLGPLKVFQEYRPRLPSEWIIGLLSLVGIARTWKTNATEVFLWLHLCTAFQVACTWSVEGRFLVPLMFSLHVWAAQAFSKRS